MRQPRRLQVRLVKWALLPGGTSLEIAHGLESRWMGIGATLIERVIVVCILWILTGLIFPNCADAILRALAARDTANARTAAVEAEINRISGKTAVPVTGTSALTSPDRFATLQQALSKLPDSSQPGISRPTGSSNKSRMQPQPQQKTGF